MLAIVPLVFTFIFSDEQNSLTLAQMHLRNQPLSTVFLGLTAKKLTFLTSIASTFLAN